MWWRLLRLLGPDLGQLALTARLASILTGLGVEAVVPPAEAGGVVANEALVVQIVVVGTSPEGQDVAQAPGEVVAGVGIDGLEQTEHNPQVHGDQVHVLGDGDPDDGGSDNTETQEHDLDRGRVLGGEAKGCAVGVVQLVDRFVERAVVQRPVEPVVPGVLDDEEDGNLHGDLPGGRERNAVVEAKVSGNGVEEPDLGQFDGAVANQDEPSALPLLFPCGYLGL